MGGAVGVTKKSGAMASVSYASIEGMVGGRDRCLEVVGGVS